MSAYNLTWTEAAALAKDGQRVRRWAWETWLEFRSELWWIGPTRDEQAIVEAGDFGRLEFLVSDWTTAEWSTATACVLPPAARHRAFVPPVLSMTASRIGSDVTIAATLSDGTFPGYRLAFRAFDRSGHFAADVGALAAAGSLTRVLSADWSGFVTAEVTAYSDLPLPPWSESRSQVIDALPALTAPGIPGEARIAFGVEALSNHWVLCGVDDTGIYGALYFMDLVSGVITEPVGTPDALRTYYGAAADGGDNLWHRSALNRFDLSTGDATSRAITASTFPYYWPTSTCTITHLSGRNLVAWGHSGGTTTIIYLMDDGYVYNGISNHISPLHAVVVPSDPTVPTCMAWDESSSRLYFVLESSRWGFATIPETGLGSTVTATVFTTGVASSPTSIAVWGGRAIIVGGHTVAIYDATTGAHIATPCPTFGEMTRAHLRTIFPDIGRAIVTDQDTPGWYAVIDIATGSLVRQVNTGSGHTWVTGRYHAESDSVILFPLGDVLWSAINGPVLRIRRSQVL